MRKLYLDSLSFPLLLLDREPFSRRNGNNSHTKNMVEDVKYQNQIRNGALIYHKSVMNYLMSSRLHRSCTDVHFCIFKLDDAQTEQSHASPTVSFQYKRNTNVFSFYNWQHVVWLYIYVNDYQVLHLTHITRLLYKLRDILFFRIKQLRIPHCQQFQNKIQKCT